MDLAQGVVLDDTTFTWGVDKAKARKQRYSFADKVFDIVVKTEMLVF